MLPVCDNETAHAKEVTIFTLHTEKTDLSDR
jgi:hypothetical protein